MGWLILVNEVGHLKTLVIRMVCRDQHQTFSGSRRVSSTIKVLTATVGNVTDHHEPTKRQTLQLHLHFWQLMEPWKLCSKRDPLLLVRTSFYLCAATQSIRRGSSVGHDLQVDLHSGSGVWVNSESLTVPTQGVLSTLRKGQGMRKQYFMISCWHVLSSNIQGMYEQLNRNHLFAKCYECMAKQKHSNVVPFWHQLCF